MFSCPVCVTTVLGIRKHILVVPATIVSSVSFGTEVSSLQGTSREQVSNDSDHPSEHDDLAFIPQKHLQCNCRFIHPVKCGENKNKGVRYYSFLRRPIKKVNAVSPALSPRGSRMT